MSHYSIRPRLTFLRTWCGLRKQAPNHYQVGFVLICRQRLGGFSSFRSGVGVGCWRGGCSPCEQSQSLCKQLIMGIAVSQAISRSVEGRAITFLLTNNLPYPLTFASGFILVRGLLFLARHDSWQFGLLCLWKFCAIGSWQLKLFAINSYGMLLCWMSGRIQIYFPCCKISINALQ